MCTVAVGRFCMLKQDPGLRNDKKDLTLNTIIQTFEMSTGHGKQKVSGILLQRRLVSIRQTA